MYRPGATNPLGSAAFLSALLLICGLARGEDWPRFRGPTAQGVTSERGLPLVWGPSEDQNLRWKSPLPGVGEQARPDHNQSSPIVWQDRVFLMVAVWPQGRNQNEFPDQHVACYRASDGQSLWSTVVAPGPWKLGDLRGGYAAPTPATDGERVYVLFGSGVLVALDFAGKQIWRNELDDVQSFDVAIASSPVPFQDSVILLTDRNNQKATLTAYAAGDGSIRWRQKRPGVSFNHSTPAVVDIQGRPEMLVAASNALQGIDPADGQVRWWCDTPGDVCSPIYAGGLIYTDSGRGGPGVQIEPGGKGDITGTNVKWRISNIPEGLSSPAVVGDYVYRLHNPAVLKCWSWTDGKEVYATRLDGVSVASSPIVSPEGNLYFASAGKTFVVRAGPKYELLATNDLGEPNGSSAAVSGGRIFLKGRDHLFCIESKK
jgi:outer membrane protein assembly factor BamB